MSHNITLINRVYPPKSGASGRYIADLECGLKDKGFTVDVIHTSLGGASIALWMYPIIYIWLCLKTLCHAITHKTDTYIAASDPPCLTWAILPIAKIKRAQIIHWSHDVYPDLFAVTGPNFLTSLKAINHWILGFYDHVVVIGEDMKAVYPDTVKTAVISNWPLMDDKLDRKLNNTVTISYTGTLGLIHDVMAINRLIEFCQSKNLDVTFQFSGDGRAMDDLITAENIERSGWLSKESYLERLASSDFVLASLKHQATGLAVPSKCNQAFASGCPVLYLGGSQSQISMWLDEYGGGYDFDPNQRDWEEQFYKAMSNYMKDRQTIFKQLSQEAKELSQHYSREQGISAFSKILNYAKVNL